ncbi:MAG: hypothetical protein M0P71_07355 [Melioribacteraceae bacterium]|jgi:uncharacterized protein YqkB|nr:hypothetical protein [Melioribacteraceae bacterium]MDD3982829.1 hypothetical protein [Candidatus Omnitrophota bacterium]
MYDKLSKQYDEQIIAKIKTTIEEIKPYYELQDRKIEEDIKDVFISENDFYFFTQFLIISFNIEHNLLCFYPIFNTIDKIEIHTKVSINSDVKRVLTLSIGDDSLLFFDSVKESRLNEIVKKYFIKNIKKKTVVLINDHCNVHIDDMTIDYNQDATSKKNTDKKIEKVTCKYYTLNKCNKPMDYRCDLLIDNQCVAGGKDD